MRRQPQKCTKKRARRGSFEGDTRTEIWQGAPSDQQAVGWGRFFSIHDPHQFCRIFFFLRRASALRPPRPSTARPIHSAGLAVSPVLGTL